MKVSEIHIVTNQRKVNELLFKVEHGKKGKWFIQTAGAFGQRDMKLVPISANKADELTGGMGKGEKESEFNN